MKVDICSIMYQEEVMISMFLESWLSVPWIDRIFLVDSGSTDNSVSIANSYGPRVSIIKVPWRGSFSRQRNIAIKLAKSEYFMMPDIDEIPCGNMISNIENYKCSNNNYHLPYVKFYDWKTLWFFKNGNTPQLLPNHMVQFGNKYTMNIYKKGIISGFIGDLHELAGIRFPENKCSFVLKSHKLDDLKTIFLVGHYDQAKHFEQAKINNSRKFLRF